MSVYLSKLGGEKNKKWYGIIFSFIFGQGTLQLINLLTGFFLLRWMSKEDYAQYSIAFGFQSTLSLLVDLGFGGAIIALVGSNITDTKLIGGYVKSAKFIRNRLFFILVPASIVFYYFLSVKHGWDFLTQSLLFLSIVLAIYIQGIYGYYSTILQIRQKIKESYLPQIYSGSFRLFLSFTLSLSTILNSWVLSWINIAVQFWNGLQFKKLSTGFVEEPEESDKAMRKEMFNYLSPLIPGIVFTAFQGQISLFIISIFGKAETIADVAALGRIGQLFLFLGVFNSSIVMPFLARTEKKEVLKKYLTIFAGGIITCASILIFGFFFPQPFLWVLGAKYSNLGNEVYYTLISSCVNYLASLVWIMNSSRKWLFWWGSFAYISAVMLTQIGYTYLSQMNTAMEVIRLNILTACAVLIIQIFISISGFLKKD